MEILTYCCCFNRGFVDHVPTSVYEIMVWPSDQHPAGEMEASGVTPDVFSYTTVACQALHASVRVLGLAVLRLTRWSRVAEGAPQSLGQLNFFVLNETEDRPLSSKLREQLRIPAQSCRSHSSPTLRSSMLAPNRVDHRRLGAHDILVAYTEQGGLRTNAARGSART